MMLGQSTIKKINLILSVAIIVLSFYTIIWHHQNYLLYKQSNKVAQIKQQMLALHKQLLSEYSAKMSGTKIKQKATKHLHMRMPSAKTSKRITL